ncbi:MAG: rhodanese-like domain-containing protein [Thermoleophilia bacterium]
MAGRKSVSIMAGIAALGLSALLVMGLGCGGGTSTSSSTASAAAPTSDFSKIADTMNGFLNSPENLKTISAADLNRTLSDGNPNNDPVVLDVRDTKDYESASEKSPGHIPGAINIPFRKVASDDSIAKINAALANHQEKSIVVHCYTGHTQSLDIPVLYDLAKEGKLGNPAPKIEGLEWGMMGYNSVEKAPAYSAANPLDTTPSSGAASPLPQVTVNLQAQAQAALKDVPGRVNVGKGPQEIGDKPLGNYTIIDIRSADDYAKGHLPGAVNLPYQTLFKSENGTYPNLEKIGHSKPILVTGNTQFEEEFVAIGLNLLNIDQKDFNTGALGFNIASWNNTVGKRFGPSDKHDYPVVTGSAPGGTS